MSPARHIPNLLTLMRILLTAPVVVLLLHEEYRWSLLLFLVAGISDAVDGFLAKQFHWESWLGSVMDPLADKLLLVSSTLCLAWVGLLPIWLVAAVFLRDFLIIGGALYWHRHYQSFEAEPTVVSKINTFTQIVLVLVVVAQQGFALFPDSLAKGLVWFTLATTLTSGADYVWTWGRRAQAAVKK